MKKIIFFLLYFLLCINLYAQNGISFAEGNWETILQTAKEQNKIVFVDAYTTWCGPCKMMAKNIFPMQEVGDFFNQHFINAKIDMEKGEGIEIAQRYRVNAYPTFLFVNGDGELVHRGIGYRPVEQFIALAEAAIDPDRQLVSLEKQYEAGNREQRFILGYIAALNDAGRDVSEVAEAYLATQTDLLTPANMGIIYSTTTSYQQKGFSIITQNKDAFYTQFGKKEVQQLLAYLIEEEFAQDMDKVLASYDQFFEEDAERLKAQFKMNFYMYEDDDNSKTLFVQNALAYMEQYGSDAWDELNSVAWRLYEVSNEAAVLKKALNWGLKSVKIESNYYNNDTVAWIYFKLNNKKKAKKYAQIAIKKAEEGGGDASSTKGLLEQL